MDCLVFKLSENSQNVHHDFPEPKLTLQLLVLYDQQSKTQNIELTIKEDYIKPSDIDF